MNETSLAHRFVEDGYLVVESVVSREELDAVIADADDVHLLRERLHRTHILWSHRPSLERKPVSYTHLTLPTKRIV